MKAYLPFLYFFALILSIMGIGAIITLIQKRKYHDAMRRMRRDADKRLENDMKFGQRLKTTGDTTV